MASASLRRYDVQARISVIVSLIAAVGVIFLAAVLYRNFDAQTMSIIYNRKTIYAPTVYGTTALTIMLAAIAIVLGFNSAGQRRNEKQSQSWMGFFIGAAVLSLSIILFAMFYMYRFSQT